jgi:hypothetical protein
LIGNCSEKDRAPGRSAIPETVAEQADKAIATEMNTLNVTGWHLDLLRTLD